MNFLNLFNQQNNLLKINRKLTKVEEGNKEEDSSMDLEHTRARIRSIPYLSI